MKNFSSTFFTLLFSFLAISLSAQNVDKNVVVIEIGTGTWCQFCPGSALAADDMAHFGKKVAIIEHHNGDAYTTTDSDTRLNYFGITGFPTTYFDGGSDIVGGDLTSSIVRQYIPPYNALINQPSPIDMDLKLTSDGMGGYTAEVMVERVSNVAPANLSVHFVLTESHIAANWFGLKELNFVNRLMLPNHAGTSVNLALNTPTTVTHNFTLNANWVKENMQIVAFVENRSNKVIYQGLTSDLSTNDHAVNVAMEGFADQDASGQCVDVIAPNIEIRNLGTDPLTSLDIRYIVNTSTNSTFQWTGNLGMNEVEAIQLPGLSYASLDSNNSLVIQLTSPNGTNDGDMSNNFFNHVWDAPTRLEGDYRIRIQPDNFGSEIRWELKDGAGNVAYSGGPYQNNNLFLINKRINLQPDCYTFHLYDSYGDGLGTDGWVELKDPNSDVMYNGGYYGDGLSYQFTVESANAIAPQLNADQVSIFPNPTNGLLTVALQQPLPGNAAITVYQADGRQVHTQQQYVGGGTASFKLDFTGLARGLYLVKVETAEGQRVEKISLK